MLRTLCSMLKNDAPYREKVVDREALRIQCDAPRWMKILVKHGFMPATITIDHRVTAHITRRSSLKLATGQHLPPDLVRGRGRVDLPLMRQHLLYTYCYAKWSTECTRSHSR